MKPWRCSRDNLTTNSMKAPPWGEVKGEKEKKENGLKL